jgi:hypothetical protein
MITSPMTSLRLVGVLTAAAVLAAACGGGGGDADETTTTQETTTTEAPIFSSTTTTTTTRPAATTTTTLPEAIRQPLTGEPVASDDELITRPALAVKIDNANQARVNHTGLAVADIVFEEIVEDNNTRFAAVFHTNDADPVGPIRSGRSQDVDILSSFNEPLFAWSGGNPGVTRIIRESFLTDLNAQRSPGYFRGPGSAPHDLYSSTDALYEQTPEDHPGAPPIQWNYVAANSEFAGVEVAGFDLEMRRRDITWEWNPETSRFMRIMDGEFHVDKTYGPIDATNVIVMVVEYRPSAVDARSPEAQTLGEGLVYVFSNGELIEGKWDRTLAVAPIRFNDLDGNPIPLTPGNTWIELAEFDGSVGEGESPVAMIIRGR